MLTKHGIFAGVDIGGTKTAIVLSSAPPHVLERIVFPTLPANGPEHAVASIISSIHEGLARQGFEVDDLIAIGVSCGSPLDSHAGVIQSPPNLQSWDHVPIKAILEREFGVECLLENDANAGALAEFTFGAGRGTTNMVFLTMGTGLGAGLILNGQLYRGCSDAAGEIGHVRLSNSGPSGYGKVGSAEGWASGAGMARVAKMARDEAITTSRPTLLTRHGEELTAQLVWEAAQAGDSVAIHVVETCGEKLGEAIAILTDILNPERVVVGGLAIRMREAILGPARRALQREAVESAYAACEIVVAELGEEIGDVAALVVATKAGQKARSKASAA
jgi:glucokinase